MSEYLLARIDDRLLHGQVALGWRHALDPEAFLIVDDEVARDALAIHLFQAALPEGMQLVIRDADSFLNAREPLPEPRRTVLLVRELAILEGLCAKGFRPHEVNIGGVHHRAGARRYLDYVYLTEEDRAVLQRLIDLGIVLYAQDLPSSPRKPAEELLAGGGGER